MRIVRYILVAACYFLPVFGYTQELLLRHFIAQDGLASNTVYQTFQDSKGFVWFCTNQGISRFDGHSFENFTTSHGLPDNEIFALKEDSYGRLWVTSYNAKISFIYNGKVFNANNNVFCQYIEQDPVLLKMRLDAGYTLPHILLNGIPDLAMRLKAYFYFNAGECIYLFHKGGADYFFMHNHICLVTKERIQTLFTSRRKGYYYNDFLYLCLIQNEKWSLSKVSVAADTIREVNNTPLSFITVYEFSAFDDSTIMLATDKGVLFYNVVTGSVDMKNGLLKNIAVSSIIKDAENNFWFTTLDNGVYFLPVSKPVVYHKDNSQPGAIATLPSGAIIGSYNSGSVQVIDEHKTVGFLLPGFVKKDRILKIIPASNHRFIIGTDNGVYSIDKAAGAIKKFTGQILTSAIKDVYRRNARIYVASVHGACEADSNGDLLQQIWKNRTTAIAASDTAVWLGTLQGVYKYAHGKGVQKLEVNPQLSDSRITDIEISGNGDVIFLTSQDGIFIWNGVRMQHIDESVKLSSNICKTVFVDEGNNIWVLTNSGIDRLSFNNNEYNVVHFPLLNGLSENNIIDFAIAGQKLYISCEDGIVELNIQQHTPGIPLKTYITSVSLSDTTFISPEKATLSYKHTDLTIHYTAIALTDGQNVTYKYLLEGGEADTVITKLTSVNLSAISPGSYIFKVWAKSSNSIWTHTPAIFTFTIAPPFWQKTWFLLAVLSGVIVLVIVLVRRRITAIRNTERNKTYLNKKMAKLEMQALRSQINPHFIFNALNAIQNYYNLNDERNANRYMTMFANLIRKTLTYSSNNWITLSEEANMLRTYIELEKMRFKNIFDYEISISAGIDAESTKIPAMMIQPFVENAINHGLRHLRGTSGKLIVSFAHMESGILCVIDDNGVGFKHAAIIEHKKRKHKSMGMGITIGRIDTMNLLYNTSISIQVIHKEEITPPGRGTIVQITIPLIKTMNDE